MTVKDLERLFDYSHWANRQLFEVLSQMIATQTERLSYLETRPEGRDNHEHRSHLSELHGS